jgi:preprotein translocase subunit SecG
MTVLVYFVTFTYLLFALVIHVVSAQRKRKNKTENEKREKA